MFSFLVSTRWDHVFTGRGLFCMHKELICSFSSRLNLNASDVVRTAHPLVHFRYMKYLYPYECDKRGLSNPNELQAAIDSNRREGRRQSFGSSLFTYSPNGTPTMLSSPKVHTPSVGLTVATNGASLTPIQKIKKGGICSNTGLRFQNVLNSLFQFSVM